MDYFSPPLQEEQSSITAASLPRDSLISFKLFKIKEVIPYTYYAFPIVALTGSTGLLVTIFYFFKSLVVRIGNEERPLVSFSFSIFFSVALIFFFITTLAGYHFFPPPANSTLLDSVFI